MPTLFKVLADYLSGSWMTDTKFAPSLGIMTELWRLNLNRVSLDSVASHSIGLYIYATRLQNACFEISVPA